MYLARIVYALVVLNVSFCASIIPLKSAVTYTLSGGRFGDNLLAYCHAKWISYRYGIPLLYKPFQYSDQLMMHVLEDSLSGFDIQQYSAVVDISQCASCVIEPDAGILYVVPYFPESIIERANPRYFFYFPVDWQDSGFKTELQKMICLRTRLNKIAIPEGCISIALHVRTGTGFDIPTIADYPKLMADNYSQLKFPPFSYYIQQLRRVIGWSHDKKLYIHLFTDHDNPQELADYFQQMLDNKIIIHSRPDNNGHDRNVLEDFFAMTQFDCIIRPDANFSLVASKLGDYHIQISPWHSTLINNEYVIDQICINNQILIQPIQLNEDFGPR